MLSGRRGFVIECLHFICYNRQDKMNLVLIRTRMKQTTYC